VLVCCFVKNKRHIIFANLGGAIGVLIGNNEKWNQVVPMEDDINVTDKYPTAGTRGIDPRICPGTGSSKWCMYHPETSVHNNSHTTLTHPYMHAASMVARGAMLPHASHATQNIYFHNQCEDPNRNNAQRYNNGNDTTNVTGDDEETTSGCIFLFLFFALYFILLFLHFAVGLLHFCNL